MCKHLTVNILIKFTIMIPYTNKNIILNLYMQQLICIAMCISLVQAHNYSHKINKNN